jgi:aldehyde dehydrogenase (NAD+)
MALDLRETYGFHIGGVWVEPGSGRTMEVVNPSTGEMLCRVGDGGSGDVDGAVAAARSACKAWGRTTALRRQDALNGIARILEENGEYLAEIVSSEMGMPREVSTEIELPGAADHFKYFAGCIRAEEGFVAAIDGESYGITLREPRGVCGLIVPWNFPLGIAAWKLAPALAAGNTVVIKPSSASPVSLLEMARLIGEADVLPKGVLNVVTGSGATCGRALAAHPGVDKLSITGSVEAGRSVLSDAASNVTPATMELGGKSPNIFFEDCDMDMAVEGALLGLGVYNQGEVCSAGTRALVQASIHDEFVRRVVAVMERIRIGVAWDEKTQMGPLVSREQMEKVLSYVEIGRKEGATLVTGGSRITDPPLDRGWFVRPAVFTKVDNGMRIAREEIFGPVLCVIPYETEEEAIALANESEYGLAAGVWTRDVNRVFRVSRELKTGKVWVNTYDQVPAHVPFGGSKRSGYGRETHKMALDEYSTFKNIYLSLADRPMGLYPES